jgi:hypothetical protein
MTPKKRRNTYVQASGGDERGFRAGMGKLLAECKELNAARAWVICPEKGTFIGSHIEAALGKDRAKALGKGEAVIVNSVSIEPRFATKLPMAGDGVPVLAAYLSEKDLTRVDELYEVPSLVVVPFAPAADAASDKDSAKWLEKWKPELIQPA